MRKVFIGHFRPTKAEFTKLWGECIFTIDANVLLNLYRYSSATRQELEKSLMSVSDNVFITHQAAKEFLRNRLTVTAGQASEYSKATKSIKDLLATLSSKDRHPFLPDAELPRFKQYYDELVTILERQQQILIDKLTEDEILNFVEHLFDGKTGLPFDAETLEQIAKEGEIRYQKEIPPGYKDNKKDSADDQYRRFGDLIVWKQIIEQAKSRNKPIIFITDDKKEDWWLEQSGKTIGPRPEIVEEFYTLTNQNMWMYTVDKFIQETARKSKSTVSEEVLEEIIKVSLESQEEDNYDKPLIKVSQDYMEFDSIRQSGILVINLNKPMRYATGTGKFEHHFSNIPSFNVEFLDSPYEDNNAVGLSFGCGTVKNFNIHIKAKRGYLEAGNYVFRYTASEEPSEITQESDAENTG